MARCERCGKRRLLPTFSYWYCPECTALLNAEREAKKLKEQQNSSFTRNPGRPSEHGKAEMNINISVTSSMRTFYDESKQTQKSEGPLSTIPLDAWNGYKSPSGGYVSYGRFVVAGKHPTSGKRTKRLYRVRTEEDAVREAEKAGLVGPFSVTIEPSTPPSERQMQFAMDLEAFIPDDACMDDVSAIISRITENDESPASADLAKYAFEKGLLISRFSGDKQLRRLIDQAHDR